MNNLITQPNLRVNQDYIHTVAMYILLLLVRFGKPSTVYIQFVHEN